MFAFFSILDAECVFVPLGSTRPTRSTSHLFDIRYFFIHMDLLENFTLSPFVTELSSSGQISTRDLTEYGFVLVCIDTLSRKNKTASSTELNPITQYSHGTVTHTNEDNPVISLQSFGKTPPLKTRSISYVMLTSGTTGPQTPVHVPHCCIVPNVLDLCERFDIGEDDTIFNAAPFTFDPYIVEVCVCVCVCV